jgi:uncharacterized protein (TIGR04255 family)
MERETHYKNPPIVEAVVDLRFEGVDKATGVWTAEAREAFSGDFSKAHEIVQGSLEFRIRPGGQSKDPDIKVIGVRFESGDGKKVVQLTNQGIGISRLQPYESWADLRSLSLDIWTRLLPIVKPKLVKRVALRYINRIDVPANDIRLEEYLKVYATIPQEFPAEPHSFLARVQAILKESNGQLILNQALVKPTRPEVVSVVLDVDVFVQKDFDVESAKIWEVLDTLRVEKNRVFEASITDKSREMFNS